MFEKILKYFVISVISIFNLKTSNNNYVGVYCWKPIPGPPTSFSIAQSHPAISAAALVQQQSLSQQTRNTINDAAAGGSERSYALLNDHNSAAVAEFINNDNEDIVSADYRGIKFNGKSFLSTGFDEDACSVDKYAFDHVGTVTFKNKIPKLDQFTICFWTRFTNHTGDHTIFTYSVRDEPREIQIWIANSKGSSYVSMAIHGQSIYRLNYPMKMRMWHHACTSWNGKTGEWQLWIKTERVGRGFHNRLVNHKIPSNGIAFSGGPSVTGLVADGLHFEMTLLQIYKVALTAGKAHRNHKHHHVHRFNHNGLVATTPPLPALPSPPAPVMNSLLVNGQIPTRIQINLARPPVNQQQMLSPASPGVPGIPSQIIGGILLDGHGSQNQATFNTNFVNGQFNTASRLLSQQLLSVGSLQPQPNLQESQPSAAAFTFPSATPIPPQLINPSNVQYIDEVDAAAGSRFIFKRDSSTNEKSISKRETKTDEIEVHNENNDDDGKKLQKRGLVALNDGSIIDDALLAHGYQFEGLAQFGLPDFKRGLQLHMSIEDEVKEHDKEPAEEEVKAVMNLCTACDVEPFKGAVAFAWKNVIASQEHTLKGRSVGGCGYF